MKLPVAELRGIKTEEIKANGRLGPQETLVTMNYSIRENLSALSGADLVLIWSAFMMNSCFSRNLILDMREILRTYHHDYEELIENICEIVLQNAI